MARKKKDKVLTTKEKKSPMKLSAIPRTHQGKTTEPWLLLDRLVKEMSESEPKRFGHLVHCRIKLWWTRDWKADADGVIVGAQVCKATELMRLLVEESDGKDSPDIFILLPREQWKHLDDTEKEHRVFHELCHIRPSLDTTGQQKRDAKDHLLWRIGRHPIACFPEELKRFGQVRVLGHNDAIAAVAEVAVRPLLKAFDAAEAADAKKPDGWMRLGIQRLELPPAVEQYLVDAGHKTIGSLHRWMAEKAQFWDGDMKVGGTRKPPRFRERVEDAFRDFWAEHPEFCQKK